MYEQIIKEQFLVTVADGTQLAVTIHRPDVTEPLPCLMTYTPYRVGTGLGGVDLLDFAKYGYVTMIYDVRGTGDSSGVNDSVYCDGERSDGLFMIDWASKQPWCDGQVGMWGISYGAIISLQMAAEVPSALKAIIARSGSDDPFAEWTNLGGVPRNYIYESYSPFMSARNFAPPSPQLWGERWEEIWKERLEKSTPWGISFLDQIEDSKFWRDRAARAKLKAIKCPVFVVEGWSDWYSNPMLRIYGRLNAPKRALIGPWGHQWPHRALPGPRIDWEKEALLWWDHWLKGAANGLSESAPLTIFVEEAHKPTNYRAVATGSYFTDTSWPISTSESKRLFLDLATDSLVTEAPKGEVERELPYTPRAGAHSGKVGGGPFRYNVLRPLDQRLENTNSLTLVGEVIKEEFRIIGNPKLQIQVASDCEIGQLSATLVDQAPDGTETLISRQFQNLSYANYPTKVEALRPGEFISVEIELVAAAYEMRAGHRLALKLATADFLMSWPPVRPFTLTLKSAKAELIIPKVVTPAAKAPTIKPLANDVEPVLPEVSFEIFEDLANDELGYRFQSKSVFGNVGEFRFKISDPARAAIRARSIYEEMLGDKRVEVAADCATISDATSIRHEVEITITLGGAPYWSKKWEITKQRRYF